jgi:hypothetical protein
MGIIGPLKYCSNYQYFKLVKILVIDGMIIRSGK